MRKYLLPAITITLLFSACSKKIEDRIVGSWKLRSSYKQQLFDRDHFTTGYEIGIFTFSDNGNATYTSSTDTLTGNWRADRYNSGGSDGNQMRHLRIELVNFLQNRFLFWEFDDFNFRNSWRTLRTEEFSLSYTRVYEFERE